MILFYFIICSPLSVKKKVVFCLCIYSDYSYTAMFAWFLKYMTMQCTLTVTDNFCVLLHSVYSTVRMYTMTYSSAPLHLLLTLSIDFFSVSIKPTMKCHKPQRNFKIKFFSSVVPDEFSSIRLKCILVTNLTCLIWIKYGLV